MEETIVNDGPEDHCFACGHQNDQGLKLRFRRLRDHEVETLYTVPAHFRGAPGVVHGGIQATLLDEIMGIAIHSFVGETEMNAVTLDFRLRYRRPTRTETPLTIRGRVVRAEKRDYFVEGEIRDAEGEVLTRAEARWRKLDPSD